MFEVVNYASQELESFSPKLLIQAKCYRGSVVHIVKAMGACVRQEEANRVQKALSARISVS